MAREALYDILLEVGTNEVEFLEFYLGKRSFGVNVAKVKQLIPFEPEKITQIPDRLPSVEGALHHLGSSIPIVNLKKHLKHQDWGNDAERQIIVITEFNQTVTGFVIDGVNKIHRLSWEQLQPVPPALEAHNPKLTGVVLVQDNEILILDFEHIIDDISATHERALAVNSGNSGEAKESASVAPAKPGLVSEAERAKERPNKSILFADDSKLFRDCISEYLNKAGYSKLQIFENGRDLLHHLRQQLQDGKRSDSGVTKLVDLILTDIEMPQLDGLSLCKQVKDHYPGLPVVILSSLITPQMSLKCQSVGANENVSKKELNRLIQVLDRLLF